MQTQLIGTITLVIKIDKHIEILLLDNDCVIVPGLGGFMAHHVCAVYNTETQTFIPPTRQLGFNAQLQINDSLLAQSYIEAYDISYPEALRRIEDEVTELKQKIQNEGFCELYDIGVLRLNVEGKIEFEPCEAGILTPRLYGLNTLDIRPLAAVASAEQKKPKTVISPINNEQPKPIPQLTKHTEKDVDVKDVADDNGKTKDYEPHITIRISTLKHLGTVAAVILALFVFALPFGKMIQPEISKSYLDTGILYNILPEGVRSPSTDTSRNLTFNTAKPVNNDSTKADTTAKELPAVDNTDVANDLVAANAKVQEAKEAEKKNVAAKADQNAKAEQKTKIEQNTNGNHFFSIVLASRVTKTNAEEFVGKLKKSGFGKAEVVSRANGSKVIYGRFTSEAEAQKFLRDLRSSAEAFTDGWVMEFN